MVQVNKIGFTTEELGVVTDRSFVLLKHAAIKKITDGFGELERNLKKDIGQFDLPVEGLNTSTGKIFKGENYQLFPYVLLDYPRLFNTKSIFAFRTMFWWGHEFSFTIHVQGEALSYYRPRMEKNIDQLMNQSVYYCVNENPWHYHFGTDNYLPIEEILNEHSAIPESKSFIKLSRKLPIDQFDLVYEYGKETMELFFSVLK